MIILVMADESTFLQKLVEPLVSFFLILLVAPKSLLPPPGLRHELPGDFGISLIGDQTCVHLKFHAGTSK